jgi:hypothetical protein
MRCSTSIVLERTQRFAADLALSPITFFAILRAFKQVISLAPDKILRSCMSEGPDRAFIPGESVSTRAARVPVATSLIASSLLGSVSSLLRLVRTFTHGRKREPNFDCDGFCRNDLKLNS